MGLVPALEMTIAYYLMWMLDVYAESKLFQNSALSFYNLILQIDVVLVQH